MNKLSLENYQRPKLEVPGNEKKVLLHSCCAPCCGEILEAMLGSELTPLVLFYNPNIYPQSEYLFRKDENKRFAEKLGVPFVDADYDYEYWLEQIKGLENEPERGRRCEKCFDVRLEYSARYAHENGFKVMCSTLGISRWKNFEQITERGKIAAAAYPGLSYWDLNWRRLGGSQRMSEISRREDFYRQNYCGCEFSLT
jgi:predicted adenine nucleotide alpha hydrolase (AANH) superfamily ATPase